MKVFHREVTGSAGWLAAAIAVMIAAAGCRSTQAPESSAGRRPMTPAANAPELLLAGFTVEDFPRHSTLASWTHSRQLLEAAARVWLQLPPEQIATRHAPTRRQLQRYLTEELPALVRPDQLVLFYVGTHQLADGRLLLADGEQVSSTEFAAWLGHLPARRVVLLADVCFASVMERNAAFVGGVTRLYASRDAEKAPDIPLDGSLREIKAFFGDTDGAVRSELGLDHATYSLFPYLFVHVLRQELQRQGSAVRIDDLYTGMSGARDQLAPRVRRIRIPDFAAVNLQPWILANVQPAITPAAQPPPAPTSLDDLLAMPAEQIDAGLGNLLVGQMLDPAVDIPGRLAEVDRMAEALRQRIGEERRPQEVAGIINRYLFSEVGLRAVDEPYAADFSLDDLLANRRGRCSSLVSLYLALGQRLGIAFRGVCIPEHIFVRWIRRPDSRWQWPAGVDHLNIETTRGGELLPDARYEQVANWERSREGASFYLQPLDARGTIVALLGPLASALLEQGDLEGASTAAEAAIREHPGDAEAWNILGSVRRRQEKNELALLCYRRAIAINRGFAEAWNNLATVTSDPLQRVAHLQQAVKLKPQLGDAWANLAFTYAAQERYDLALACIKRCQELHHPLPPDFVRAVMQQLQ